MSSAAERIPRLHNYTEVVHIRHDCLFLIVRVYFILHERRHNIDLRDKTVDFFDIPIR